MLIRSTSIEDLKLITKIARQTFTESYAHLNNPKDFKNYLDSYFNEDKLKSEMENVNSMFFIGEQNSQILGYLKLNTGSAQTDRRFDDALEIERIYILKSHQNQGHGKKMITYAFDIAKDYNLTRVWLGVWERNPAAIRFYKRLNFNIVGSHIFTIGEDVQNDHIMSLELTD